MSNGVIYAGSYMTGMASSLAFFNPLIDKASKYAAVIGVFGANVLGGYMMATNPDFKKIMNL